MTISPSEQLKRLITLCRQLRSPLRIMEVCGTHTVAIQRSGLRCFFPKNLKLISGPGCPVCVTPTGYIDALISLAKIKNNIITSYGDMIRVPGTCQSLQEVRAEGGDVRVISSAADSLRLAKENPAKQVVFAAVGFETTTPPTADVILKAKENKITNFSVLCSHKLVIPAMTAILNQPACAINGFLCPGHVSIMIGKNAYEPIVQQFHRPCVIGGFDIPQIVSAVVRIIEQVIQKKAIVENVYSAVVGDSPQPVAKSLVEKVFEPADTEWRALGIIVESGMKIKEDFLDFTCEKKFGIEIPSAVDPPGCRCGEVIQGLIDPPECALFGKRCIPADPVGPCMVSSEGACSAWYNYRSS